MSKAPLNEMTSYALHELETKKLKNYGILVICMCKKWPNAPALSIVYSLTYVAVTLGKDKKRKKSLGARKDIVFKMAALVAADIYAVEGIRQAPAKASDLLYFWRRIEPLYFNTRR